MAAGADTKQKTGRGWTATMSAATTKREDIAMAIDPAQAAQQEQQKKQQQEQAEAQQKQQEEAKVEMEDHRKRPDKRVFEKVGGPEREEG